MALEKVLEISIRNYNPHSVFMYGSKRANSDNV